MCDLACRRLLGCYSDITDDLIGHGTADEITQNDLTSLIIKPKSYEVTIFRKKLKAL